MLQDDRKTVGGIRQDFQDTIIQELQTGQVSIACYLQKRRAAGLTGVLRLSLLHLAGKRVLQAHRSLRPSSTSGRRYH
jgi:hypothetical protein